VACLRCGVPSLRRRFGSGQRPPGAGRTAHIAGSLVRSTRGHTSHRSRSDSPRYAAVNASCHPQERCGLARTVPRGASALSPAGWWIIQRSRLPQRRAAAWEEESRHVLPRSGRRRSAPISETFHVGSFLARCHSVTRHDMSASHSEVFPPSALLALAGPRERTSCE
jgi:hypothetical protein